MFQFGKRKAATEQATREIGWVKDVAERRGVSGLLFWSDSYLLGFVQGIVAVIIGKLGANLSQRDQARVYVDAITANGMEDAVPLVMLMEKLTSEPDANFLRGSHHGMNVLLLQTGRFPPQAYDETIKLAIADAGNIAQWATQAGHKGSARNLNAAAAIALRERYLGPHLEKHIAMHLWPGGTGL